MTIFNNQKVVENSLAARVASLFTVLNDDKPINVANDNNENIAAFVGHGLFSGQSQEPDITETKRVVRNGILEAIRTVPKIMTMYGDAGLITELEQQYLQGLEFARFAGGTDVTDPSEMSIRSPWYDYNIAKLNNVVESDSFVKGYALLNKVGRPYILVNPKNATTAEVKELTDLYPDAIISMPRWLIDGNVSGLQDIKGIVTTTQAMAVTKLEEPELTIEEHAEGNLVTYRLSGNIAGIETFKHASAIIKTAAVK